MKVTPPAAATIDLGVTEETPTIGIKDYSRRVTDDFGVTTVVQRGFSRTMSVRFKVPLGGADAVARTCAALRATAARWTADPRFGWLDFDGFYNDFQVDFSTKELSFCTLTVEGLAETETVEDAGEDPAPTGASSLLLLRPVELTDAMLVASSVPETDYPAWAAGTTYATGARVIKTATHRVYESAADGNVGNDPVGESGLWIDIGPTNRWAMFDQALGTSTSRAGSVTVTLAPGTVDALALLDVVGTSVRVQTTGYDRTIAVGEGPVTFLDLPGAAANILVTVTGSGTVSIGTLLVGHLMTLGITGDGATAGINDYSRKETDDFGEVTVVERSWAKRMSTRSLIRTDAIDIVANRIAGVRAVPSLWIAADGTDTLTVYGFFKDFSIEVGQAVSTVSLSVEGLSMAAPVSTGLPPVSWVDIVDSDSVDHPKPEDGATVGAPAGTPVGDRPAETLTDQMDAAMQGVADLFDTYGDTEAAAASAAAASAAKSAAETAEANAQQARDDAQDASFAADAARVASQTAATSAGGSATSAAGSAGAALASKTDAETAASAAQSSRVAANLSAAMLLPDRYDGVGDYFTTGLGGTPASVASAPSNATAAGFGPVYELVQTTTVLSNWATRGVVPAIAGRIYEIEYEIERTAQTGSGGTAPNFYLSLRGLDSAYTALAAAETATAYAGGVQTITKKYSDVANAGAGIAAWPAGSVWLRPSLRFQGRAGYTTTVQARRIGITDATQSEAAKASADASASSAATASVKATEAGTYASAAQGYATDASTARGQAQTYAGQAATARDDAQGHAATASSQAILSASSATAAQKAAQTTLPSTFEDGTLYFKGSNASANPTNVSPGVDATYGAYFQVNSSTANATIATRGRVPCKVGQKFKVRALMQHISGTASGPNLRLEQFAAPVGGATLGTPNSTRPALTSTTPVWVGDDVTLTATIDGFIDACVVPNYSPAQAIQRCYALELIDVDVAEQAAGSASAAATSASTASTKATEAGVSATAANSAKVAAETAQSGAASWASAASGSAATASSQAAAAATQAGLSATYAATAQANAQSKGTTANGDFDQPLGSSGVWAHSTWNGAKLDEANREESYQGRSGVYGKDLTVRRDPASAQLTTIVPGRIYKVKCSFNNPGTARAYAGLAVLDENKAAVSSNAGRLYAVGTGFTPPTNQWTDYESYPFYYDASANTIKRVTDNADMLTNSATSPAKMAYMYPLVILNYTPETYGAGLRLDYLFIEDVTESYTAGVAKDTAVAQATIATAQATSASGSASTATTQTTLGATYRDQAEGFKNTASTQAGIATTQATIATDKASAAAQSALLSANIGQGALNLNPGFDDYPSATVGQLPTGWVVSSGSAHYRVADPFGGYSVRQPGGAGSNAVIAQTALVGLPVVVPNGWYVFEVDAILNSGAWTGAGVRASSYNASSTLLSTTTITLSSTPTISGSNPTNTTGALQQWRKLIQITDATARGLRVDFGSHIVGSNAAANDITWQKVVLRAATPAEIRDQTVLAPMEATVATHDTVLATHTTQLASRVERVSAGAATAEIKFVALNSGGTAASSIGISADRVTLGTMTSPVLSISSGLATVSADLYVNGGRVIVDTGTHMKVIGKGFGTSNQFVEWFGPKMAFNLCSEANAVTYTKTTGEAYFGGALFAGVLKNDISTSSTAQDASVTCGPYGTNGGPKLIAVSWSYVQTLARTFPATVQGRSDYDADAATYASGSYTVASSSLAMTQVASGTGTVATQTQSTTTQTRVFVGTRPVSDPTTATITLTTTISFTATDNNASMGDRSTTATINRAAGVFQTITNWTTTNTQQRISVVVTEE